ncbi:MAG: anti-sigma 24 factor, partial [Leptothrix sp. (in: Bacteria)]|nr:anti-sigma 24 factor [Leptothrix sp. (in: b-proteobacteria)]
QPGAEPTGGMAAAPAPTGLVLVRDERLDEYLRAHQSARGGVAVGAPVGVMRRVDLSVPATPAR